MNCRFCRSLLTHRCLDLGSAPPSNAFLRPNQLSEPEVWFPLRLYVCQHCWLVQLDVAHERSEIFNADYVYHSSFSKSWLAHAEHFVRHAVKSEQLSANDWVVEIASNDGYLLQYFANQNIPCLGIEPSLSTASVAINRGINTLVDFFGAQLARELRSSHPKGASLIVANNVLAHVPDLNDFVEAMAILLGSEGSLSLEFPHLLRLVDGCQFDTIYHEHYSYFSLCTVERVLAQHDLRIWNVEALETHGGSLRVWACHAGSQRVNREEVSRLIEEELHRGIEGAGFYSGLQRAAEKTKFELLDYLLSAKRAGHRVVGYGAAAKGNTLLNFAGVRPDLLPWVADASDFKQGLYLPGSRIPVVAPRFIEEQQPDIVLVLPWNLMPEISRQLQGISRWGGKLASAIPRLIEVAA